MTSLLDPILALPNQSAPMSLPAKGRWAIQSLDSLSLSIDEKGSEGGLYLTKEQLGKLPNCLLKKIYAGYARAIEGASLPNHSGQLRFSIKNNGLHLNSDGRIHMVALDEDEELKKVLRTVIDQSRVIFPDAFTSVPRVPTPMVTKYIALTVPVRDDRIGLFSDLNSIGRNSATAAQSAGKLAASAFIRLSGAVGGAGNIVIGSNMAQEGNVAKKKAKECGDMEGEINGALAEVVGYSFLGVGCGMIGEYLITTAIAPAGNVGILLMAAGMFVNSIYSWLNLNKFRTELTGLLDNKQISMQEKAKQGLVFLKQQVSLTEGEWLELKSKHQKNSSALETAIENKMKEKWARFVRRVGEECASKVVSQIELIQTGVLAGDADALAKAIDLIQEVDKESYRVSVKHVIEFLLSLLYLAVGVLSFTTPFGIAVPILFAIGALVFMLIDSRDLLHTVGFQLFNIQSNPEKRWGAERKVEPLFTKEFKQNRQWKLSKLKTKLKDVLRHSGVKLLLNGNEIDTFADLALRLKLDEINFKAKKLHEEELTLEQVRALKFMALLSNGYDVPGMTESIEGTFDENEPLVS